MRSPWAPSCAFLQGYFTHSLLYYGYYSNVTLNDPCTSSPKGSVCPLAAPLLPYNLPLAYLSSVGVSFLITCILLVYRWVSSTCGAASFPFHPAPVPDALHLAAVCPALFERAWEAPRGTWPSKSSAPGTSR